MLRRKWCDPLLPLLPPSPEIASIDIIGLFESGRSNDDVEICLPELELLPEVSEKQSSFGFGELTEQYVNLQASSRPSRL